MINPEQLVERVQTAVQSALDRIFNSNYLIIEVEQPERLKILNTVNECFQDVMGVKEFTKFCEFLKLKNLSLFVESKNFHITVCFHDSFLFYKISDVVRDYYKELENEKI